MKRYKLLKDLPYAKAGEEFKEMHKDGRIVLAPEDWDQHRHEIDISDIKNFNEWFEEIHKNISDQFYLVLGNKVTTIKYVDFSFNTKTEQQYMDKKDECKSVGNYFKTKEEAEKYLEYLKAKEVIKQDTKGFRPDWNNHFEDRYYAHWNFDQNESTWERETSCKSQEFYFKSREDLEESFEKHPEEWKTYLTYEQ